MTWYNFYVTICRHSKNGHVHFTASRITMKAYCINLDRRTDRLQYMTQQFSHLGMMVERVPAIDGSLPEVAAEAALAQPTELGLRISVGAYACFQSHREVWRKIAASGETHGLVMEDDLVLAEGFSTYLQDAWVPPGADVVRLETFLTRAHLDVLPKVRAGSRYLQRLRSTHIGAGCYVLSAAAAQRLHECTTVIRNPIDVVLFSDSSELFSELAIYQMVPAPAAQQHRLHREAGTANWLTSNIVERFESEVPAEAARRETALGRAKRRLVESVRARRKGTRYIVVPFG